MAEPMLTILGGEGMLGTDLASLCQQAGCNTAVLDLPRFDITDPGQLEWAVKGSPVVVNCAAYTNVDGAESQPELAGRVNAQAPGLMGKFARQAGVYVLHISTDFVFDGQCTRPYQEQDRPNPINTYGKTKLAGEQLLLDSGCDCAIMRVQWTYGQAGNNFVKKIIQIAQSRDEMTVVDDQIGSPTAAIEAAAAILQLLEKKPLGLYHFANAGYISRFEMAKFIFERLGINTKLSPCKTSDYPTPAPRPLNSRFNCQKIQPLLQNKIENWQKPLERYLKTL